MRQEALDTSYDKAIEVQTLPNLDFSDTYEPVKGAVAVFDASQKVGYDTLSRRPVNVLALFKINKSDLDEQRDVISKKALLNEVAPQFASSPITLNHRDSDNNDCSDWQAEMGGHGNFVSIVKRLKPDKRSYDWYIAVQAGAPLVNEDLWDMTQQNAEGITFGELADSMDYNYTQLAAERNVRRLAFEVADKLNLPVKYGKDSFAFREEVDDVPPMLANPTYMQVNSCIKRLPYQRNKVAVYNHAVDADAIGDMFFVAADPYAGLCGFNAEFTKMPKDQVPLAMPSCTGRNPEAKQNSTINEEARRIEVAVWEDTPTETATNARVASNTYRQVNRDFVKELRNLGWDTALGYENYTTVITKISSNKRRPRN